MGPQKTVVADVTFNSFSNTVLFLFTDSEICEIVNKTQLQNISLNDITKAIKINYTTIELADTSEEHSRLIGLPKTLYLSRFKL